MKKRLLTIAASLLCTLFTFAQFSGPGSGTESDPYLIMNPVQLNQLRNFLNEKNIYFKLIADIDLTDFIGEEYPMQGWQPVGNITSNFKGILDGNGHKITGLYIDRSNYDYIGLFGYMRDGTIKNLTIENAIIKGQNYVGLLVGDFYNGSIKNCSVSGNIIGESYLGGCSGASQNGAIVSDVYSTVNVEGNDYSGGIVGDAHGTISNCNVNSIIKGNNYIGGITGQNSYKIENCSFVGKIIGNNNHIGGICGYTKSNIIYCYSLASVTGYDNVGGICGSNDAPSGTSFTNSVGIDNSIFSGSVIGHNNIGGIVGYHSARHILHSLVEGKISGTDNVGGLCGWSNGGWYRKTATTGVTVHPYIKSSVVTATAIMASGENVGRICGKYFDPSDFGELGTSEENKSFNRTLVVKNGVVQEISDDFQNGTGVGKTTLRMKSSYVAMGWDFDGVWTIQETESYPYLQRQTACPIITSEIKSGATTVSGRCVNNGVITLDIDGIQQQVVSSGNEFSFDVAPLQTGHEVRVCAKVEGKSPSCYATEVVTNLGKGTKADPFLIYNAADLNGIYRKGYFSLMNDINLTEYIDQFSPIEGWVSIGNESVENIGFEGNGHTISGLWSNTTRYSTGLFSSFTNITIKNLTIETAEGKMVKGGNNTGILIGKMINGTIENCQVTGSVSGDSPTGGLVGFMDGGNINHCETFVTVTSQSENTFVGGLVGKVENGDISQCKSEVTLTSTGSNSYIGGLVGDMVSGTIDQCFTKGTLTGSGAQTYMGGLIGQNAGVVTNSHSEASVTSTYIAAGLVAYNFSTVDKCHASGNLLSNNYAAGIIGYNDGTEAVVRNCVAINDEIGIIYDAQQTQQGGGSWQRILGGLKNNPPAPEMNNYALKTMSVSVNGVPKVIYDDIMNGTAKSLSDLMSTATYQGLGWDFSLVWDINEGSGYPFLQWETENNSVTQIILDKTTLSIEKGNEATITANVIPQNATNKQLNWSSSNEDVATVENGVVTAMAVGTATITAAATDGSGLTATCQVTVTANKDAAIAALQELVAEAQALYDNSTEGENVGEYAPGSRAALLAVINNVSVQISSTMSDEAISQCTEDITAAINQFQSQQVTASEDTDYSTIANTIYLERVEAAAGSQVTLSVKMKNTVEVQGYQFDLYLPEGVTVAADEDGFSLIELSTERTTTRKTDYFNSTNNEDGSFRVLCGSSKGYAFDGTDGEVAVITLNISTDMDEGEYPIILKNVVLTDKNSGRYPVDYLKSTLVISSYTMGDVNADGFIDVTDFICVANDILGQTPEVFIRKAADIDGNDIIDVADFIGVANLILSGAGKANAPKAAKAVARRAATPIEDLDDVIYVEPVTVTPGSRQTLSIQMKNSGPVAGFQFRLQLPEGITVAQDEEGFNMVELSTERTTARKTDYFNSEFQQDGTLLVLCGSSTKNPSTGRVYTFSGNEGEVARITIDVPADYPFGVYEVSVLDGVLSSDEEQRTALQSAVTSELTIGDNSIVLDENSTEIPEATDGDVNILVKRTLKKGQWSTICLPFDITAEQVYEVFGDEVQLQEFTDYEVTQYDDEDKPVSILVRFADIDIEGEGFYANYPYLIKTPADISEFRVTATITPDEENAVAEYDNGKTGRQRKVYGSLIGTYHAQTVVPQDGLFLSDNKFWYSTGETKMKAFRAYFMFNDVISFPYNSSANVDFVFEGTSAIRGVKDMSVEDGTVYTLQGQFLGKGIDLKKLPRGIYIINGKKQVIK